MLRSTPDTLRVYPFAFELTAAFALHDATLQVRVTIHNPGVEMMPASFGFHPAFRWPLPYGHPRSDHCVEFSQEELPFVRRLDEQGLLMPQQHPVPIRSRRLALDDGLFAQDALIFDEVRSRRVRFGAGTGPGIEVSLFDAPYLGIWSKPGAGFLCIEPWHGLADPQGFAGDLTRKPGIFMLGAGQARTLAMDIALI